MTVGTGTPGPMLEVSHLTKRFDRPDGKSGSLTVLDDVSLSIHRGEFVSLIGASGCGKTTFLRTMSGLLPYDEGRITLRGQDVVGIPERVGFVFQEPALLPWRTIAQNIAFPLNASRKSNRADAGTLVKRQLDLAGLGAFAAYLPGQLSGGMQQRVGLARALVAEPDVLFMDEPLSALDSFTRRALQEDVSNMIERAGATTVLVTHDIDEAIFMSDRVLVLRSNPGQIIANVAVPLARPRRHEAQIDDPVAAELRHELLRELLDATPGLFDRVSR
ncbi:MAG: ABC transporter ATP-binding protein [Acidimicrobiales bacterium]